MLDFLGIGFWTKIGVITALILGVIAYHETQIGISYHNGYRFGYEKRDGEAKIATAQLNERIVALSNMSAVERLAAEQDRQRAVNDALAGAETYREENPPQACGKLEAMCSIPDSVRVKLNRVR